MNRPSHSIDPEVYVRLEQRLGALHTRLRVGVELDHERQIFGFGRNFFHIENWYSIHGLIRACFKLAGLYKIGVQNASRPIVRHNHVHIPHLPSAFNGFRILHLSDLHVDMHAETTRALIQVVRNLEYDICVLTGDYRARTFGHFQATLEGMRRLRQNLKGIPYAVLGNHDTIQMVPELEDMGYRLLLNEHIRLQKEHNSLLLAGVDDAHFFRADNIEKAMTGHMKGDVCILLSHTPEIFRQAAYAGVDLLLCGHTHGGQICLPGGIPITLDSDCPRFVGKGAWQYQNLRGYTSCGAGTSVVNIRFNCPPEVTIHQLKGTS